jgi:hypothetical protein
MSNMQINYALAGLNEFVFHLLSDGQVNHRFLYVFCMYFVISECIQWNARYFRTVFGDESRSRVLDENGHSF